MARPALGVQIVHATRRAVCSCRTCCAVSRQLLPQRSRLATASDRGDLGRFAVQRTANVTLASAEPVRGWTSSSNIHTGACGHQASTDDTFLPCRVGNSHACHRHVIGPRNSTQLAGRCSRMSRR